MKKFGRQAQYYNNTNNQSNEKDILNNNPEIEYEDPVDLEFMNEFTKKSNTKIKNKSNIKKKKKIQYIILQNLILIHFHLHIQEQKIIIHQQMLDMFV